MNCINIKSKTNCCGCGACADICPKSCIQMKQDEDGFIYPFVDSRICLSCGKCKTVCPFLQADITKNIIDDCDAYAYVASDYKCVRSSSSGGAFSLLMDAFASDGDYVIIGAAMDGMQVKHIITRDASHHALLRKSKYVQSRTDGIFKSTEELLKASKKVLFSGTPCQVAALKSYLGQDYDNLLTVDIVCHGVPSQTVFDEYIQEIEAKYSSKIISVEFRYKRDFNTEKANPRTINIIFENGKSVNLAIAESEFLYAYHTGLLHRPSCSACKFATPSRSGDITLGDYWGIEKKYPELSSLRGVSLVRFNTEKGRLLFENFKKSGIFIKTDWAFACAENNQLTNPLVPHRNRDKFFKLRLRGIPFCKNVEICKKPDNLVQKIIRKIRHLIGLK